VSPASSQMSQGSTSSLPLASPSASQLIRRGRRGSLPGRLQAPRTCLAGAEDSLFGLEDGFDSFRSRSCSMSGMKKATEVALESPRVEELELELEETSLTNSEINSGLGTLQDLSNVNSVQDSAKEAPQPGRTPKGMLDFKRFHNLPLLELNSNSRVSPGSPALVGDEEKRPDGQRTVGSGRRRSFRTASAPALGVAATDAREEEGKGLQGSGGPEGRPDLRVVEGKSGPGASPSRRKLIVALAGGGVAPDANLTATLDERLEQKKAPTLGVASRKPPPGFEDRKRAQSDSQFRHGRPKLTITCPNESPKNATNSMDYLSSQVAEFALLTPPSSSTGPKSRSQRRASLHSTGSPLVHTTNFNHNRHSLPNDELTSGHLEEATAKALLQASASTPSIGVLKPGQKSRRHSATSPRELTPRIPNGLDPRKERYFFLNFEDSSLVRSSREDSAASALPQTSLDFGKQQERDGSNDKSGKNEQDLSLEEDLSPTTFPPSDDSQSLYQRPSIVHPHSIGLNATATKLSKVFKLYNDGRLTAEQKYKVKEAILQDVHSVGIF